MPLSTKQNAHGEVGAGFASLGGDENRDSTMLNCSANDTSYLKRVIEKSVNGAENHNVAMPGFSVIDLDYVQGQIGIRKSPIIYWELSPSTGAISHAITLTGKASLPHPIMCPAGFIDYLDADRLNQWLKDRAHELVTRFKLQVSALTYSPLLQEIMKGLL